MMFRVRSALVFAAFTALAVSFATPDAAPAQDKDKELVKQAREAAVANLKKANIDKPTAVETDGFLIVGSLPEEKAKALGEVLEKTTKLARKALKYDDKETAWKGKLTVYYLPDNAEFKALMRRAFQQPPEGVYANLRAEPPLLVDPADAPGKPSDADLYTNTAARIAGEHLKAKGTGAQNVPDWLRDGFGRATALRAEGTTSKRYLAYRAQARTAAGKVALKDVWGESKLPGGDALATAFAEYLAYGPGAVKFPMFLDGLKPTENVAEPTIPQGLDAAGWKEKDLPMLEAAWKKWVAGGK